MVTVLIIQSTPARKNRPIDLDLGALSYLQACWHAPTRKTATKLIRSKRPTVVILDLSPQDGLDFDIFEDTKEVETKRIIICETDNLAMKAIRYNIDQYLVRPVENAEIRDTLETLLFRQKLYKIQQLYHDRTAHRQATLSTIVVKSLAGVHWIPVTDILRVEDHGEFRRLSLSNGRQILSSWSLGRLLNRLAGNSFLSTTPSLAIHCQHIESLRTIGDNLHAIMTDGYAVPVPYLQEDRVQRLLHAAKSEAEDRRSGRNR